MRHSIYLTLLLVAFVSGCTPEYVPPKEAIPDIPPSLRGGEAGAPGAGAAMPAGKASGGPGKMAVPK